MARVASSPVGFHRFRPTFRNPQAPQILIKSHLHSQNRTRKFWSIASCQKNHDPTETSSTENLVDAGTNIDQDTGSSADKGFPEFPDKGINRRIALVSTLAAVGLFLSARLDFGVSLKDLSAAALPYEEALSNGKPTVVEFYADWCEVCRELAPDVYKIEQQFK
ncbi:hypothetical protein CJ030_MR5G002868 [Morella rubra]|uniref:Thioredoxin domain-containing protein n=1 Tax=Morella rubra TaxID=262757 RepID=A0A6A1VRS1_9ROSI|nr:hypothetical protein CJ030_MR5G002868 [Morella rubra]